jgi:hypothetical protein
MPSLSKQEVGSLVKGDWNNWDKLKVGNTGQGLMAWALVNAPADAPVGTGTTATTAVVHICRRENGSGTQATSNNAYLNYPCAVGSAQTIPALGNDGLNGNTGNKTEASLVALIHENSTADRVTACLNNLDLGSDTAGDGFTNPYVGVRWAIGRQALEKKDAHMEFVKINNVAPTLVNVVRGNYTDWFENTFQYNTTHPKFSTDAGLKATVDSIIKAATLPAVMNAINISGGGLTHNFGIGAYLANPKANTPPTTGIFNVAVPINPYSHTPSAAISLDNCRMPVDFNKSAAGL